jgi:hypothetical protein
MYRMNFNLISPRGNGHTFNVRFNEPIVISENSSVTMNWATFEREQKIEFKSNQKATIKVTDILPFFDWVNNGDGQVDGAYRVNGLDRGTDLEIDFIAGKYTLTQLQNVISNKLKTMAGFFTNSRPSASIDADANARATPPVFPTNASLRLSNHALVVPRDTPTEFYLEFGFMNAYPLDPLIANARHKLNIAQDVASSEINITASGGAFVDVANTRAKPAANSWNGYALGSHKYIHTGGEFGTYKDSANNLVGKDCSGSSFDELEFLNTVTMKVNSPAQDIEGCICLGLYSSGVAGVTNSNGDETYTLPVGTQALANRTNLAVLKTFEHATFGFIPHLYIGMMICGKATQVADAAGQQVGDLGKVRIFSYSPETQSTAFQTPTFVFETSLVDCLGASAMTTQPILGYQTYYDRGNTNASVTLAKKGDLHIRFFIGDKSGAKSIIYDTNSQLPTTNQTGDNKFMFSKAFMKQFDVVADAGTINEAQARASIPFEPIVYATHQDDKFVIEYSRINDFETVGGVNFGVSSINEFEIEMTEELGDIFVDNIGGITIPTRNNSLISYNGAVAFLNKMNIDMINCSLNENRYWFRLNHLNPQYLKEKLSIYLTDLPIKSYKNTVDKSKSGYRKAILANIPAPFGQSATVLDSNKVVGGYTPSVGVVNRLSNQALTTNNFNVEIRNLETDEPADLISQSIINFTIMGE